jgi:hypothetical protein
MISDTGVLSSRRTSRWLITLSGLVLVAGVVAVLIVFVFRNQTTSVNNAPITNKPAQIVKQAPNVPLTRAQREIAGKFILTAVARKNLAVSYNLVTDRLKQGLTLKQWQSGNIPVVPFDVGAGLVAPMHVLYSHPRSAELQILLLPKHGKGQFFILVLKAVGAGNQKHWLVDSWVPWAGVPIPRDNS